MPSCKSWLNGALVGLNWVVAAGWSVRAAYWLWGIRKVPNLLAEELPPNPVKLPRVSVVVPARNEEGAIGASLRALLRSTGVELEVIAVDDRSSDSTGSIMDAVAAEQPSASSAALHVLHVEALPPGWLGKTHAMTRAAEIATGGWLVFTDADVLFREDALFRALSFAEREAADHLVLLPTVICRSFGERMMISFLFTSAIWATRLWKVSDPQAKKDAIGVGAFNMIRRDAYEAVGGWESMRMEVVEDMRMGYLLRQRGFRQRVALGHGLLRIRWAEGALGVVRNLTKNAFAVFRYRTGAALMACAGIFITCILPFAGLLGPARLRPAGMLTLVSTGALYLRQRRETGANPALVFTFPLAGTLLLWTLVRSIVSTLGAGGVQWRGTQYSLKELRQRAEALR